MGQGHIYPPGLSPNQKAALDANQLLDGTNYVAGIDDVGEGSGPSGGFTVYRINFTYNGGSPQTIGSVATGEQITEVWLDVTTAFNAPTTLSVGHTGSQVALMDTSKNIPGTVGLYRVRGNHIYGGADTLKLYVNPGASSQGAGQCWVITKKA